MADPYYPSLSYMGYHTKYGLCRANSTSIRRGPFKRLGPSGLSTSHTVIEGDMVPILLVNHNKYGPSRTISEIIDDFVRKKETLSCTPFTPSLRVLTVGIL